MKKLFVISLLLVGGLFTSHAQISHGGKPLPLIPLKSVGGLSFEEMPPFDIAEEMRIDSLNESDLRSGHRFAYKHMTRFNRNNSGTSFLLPDGTKVWRLGIRSKGALSLNVLFTEYELPEGARLFLYNSDQSHIIGSFNQLNNSDLGILPVAPVTGDELIIEYQEPANASFAGRLTVGEVNHAYRSLRGREPGGNQTAFYCMPSISCYADELSIADTLARSVLLLMINGITTCTGTLVNNTANDGRPYLLTASHCLNKEFTITNPDYEQIAGTIVSFFNYKSPLCETTLRGTEEMSMASSYLRAVNEEHDMMLLELTEVPPAYYQPYYAGWNATGETAPPYYNVHHPGGSVKRLNIAEEALTLTTYEIPAYDFADNAHWNVARWTVGSTAGGSSGSPLFDSQGHVLGALSGGKSYCNRPEDDYFYAFFKTWNPDPAYERQLKHWLNPTSSAQTYCEGIDPYRSAKAIRLSNVGASMHTDSVVLATISGSATIPLFGNNGGTATEYVEAYQTLGNSNLFGAYLVTAASGNYTLLEVVVKVYGGTDKPETLLHTETFHPTYTNSTELGEGFVESPKPLDRKQETFIRFSQPVRVNSKFYIGYQIVSAPANTYFSAFSLPKANEPKNTTWIKNATSWMQASQFPGIAFNTSLFVDPVLQYDDGVPNISIEGESPVKVFLHREQKVFDVQLPENQMSGTFFLYATDGKLMVQKELNSSHTTLPVFTTQAGIYIVKVVCSDIVYRQKFLFY